MQSILEVYFAKVKNGLALASGHPDDVCLGGQATARLIHFRRHRHQSIAVRCTLVHPQRWDGLKAVGLREASGLPD